MRPYKRLILFGAFAVLAVIGSAATSEAQGRGHGGGGHVVVVAGGYSPFFYGSYLYGDPWYGEQYPYPYPYPRPYGYRVAEPDSAVRLEVTPKQAQVFVDGYYAGIVDDFDGTFQRLYIPPGEHQIELWLEGYRTVKQTVYLTPNNTFKIKYAMEKLGPGEAPPPKPQPPPPSADPQQNGYDPRMPPPGAPLPRQVPPGTAVLRTPPPQQQMPPPPPPDGRRNTQDNAAYGTLAIKVQPGDAEISIDGEAWRAPGQDRLTVEVAEGSHTVEIRKAGYRTYVTQIDVQRGRTTPLNVSLRGAE